MHISSKVNLLHANDFRALCGTILVSQHPRIWGNETLEVHRVDYILSALWQGEALSHSLTLPPSHSLTHTLALTLSHSLTGRGAELCLTHSHTLSISFSLSLTHTHSLTLSQGEALSVGVSEDSDDDEYEAWEITTP
jgi:hypothetical protein